eukprot:gene10538-281_t
MSNKTPYNTLLGVLRPGWSGYPHACVQSDSGALTVEIDVRKGPDVTATFQSKNQVDWVFAQLDGYTVPGFPRPMKVTWMSTPENLSTEPPQHVNFHPKKAILDWNSCRKSAPLSGQNGFPVANAGSGSKSPHLQLPNQATKGGRKGSIPREWGEKQNQADAQQCIKLLHNSYTIEPLSTPIQVKLANGERGAARDIKLFVGAVPPQTTEEELQKLFGPYGPIAEIAILRNSTGESKGSAFVSQFFHPQHASHHIHHVDDTNLWIPPPDLKPGNTALTESLTACPKNAHLGLGFCARTLCAKAQAPMYAMTVTLKVTFTRFGDVVHCGRQWSPRKPAEYKSEQSVSEAEMEPGPVHDNSEDADSSGVSDPCKNPSAGAECLQDAYERRQDSSGSSNIAQFGVLILPVVFK